MISRFKKIKGGLALSGVEGFTLVEMLVAVLLLTTALAGPLTIASKGISASVAAKNQVTAFFLAQDAVEYIRYKRDTNKLAGNPWLTGLEPCISTDGSAACIILDSTDTDAGPPSTCGSLVSCSRLRYYEDARSRFTYDSVTPPPSVASPIFLRRAVIINTLGVPTNSATEVSITINITWCDVTSGNTAITDLNCRIGGTANPHIVTVRENLLDWQ